MHEAKIWEKKCFVTLTYDDKFLPERGSLQKKAVQLFLKRLREEINMYVDPECGSLFWTGTRRTIKFFASGEYGEKNYRPHYHLILFGVSSDDRAVIERCWPYGFISIGDFSLQRARYVAGYAVKKLGGLDPDFYFNRKIQKEFSLSSRNPAVGKVFLDRHAETFRKIGSLQLQGKTYALPRYYRDKIYSEEDKILVRALAEDFYQEARIELCKKSGGLIDLSLDDYIKQENKQHQKNLEAKISARRL